MPLTRLTLEERIKLVRYFSMYDKSSYIQMAWKRELGKDPPSRKTIAALNKKFDETGSVADLNRSGRPKSSRTDETVAKVHEAIKLDPNKSIRHLSSELGINKAAIHRIKQEAETQTHKHSLKNENRRLKERIQELQRRVDILEGRQSGDTGRDGSYRTYTQQRSPKKRSKKKSTQHDPAPESLPPNNIISTIPTSFHPSNIHLVNIKPTVITVMSSLNPDDLHLHTHEMIDESGEIHHITLEHASMHGVEHMLEEHELVEHGVEEHEVQQHIEELEGEDQHDIEVHEHLDEHDVEEHENGDQHDTSEHELEDQHDVEEQELEDQHDVDEHELEDQQDVEEHEFSNEHTVEEHELTNEHFLEEHETETEQEMEEDEVEQELVEENDEKPMINLHGDLDEENAQMLPSEQEVLAMHGQNHGVTKFETPNQDEIETIEMCTITSSTS